MFAGPCIRCPVMCDGPQGGEVAQGVARRSRRDCALCPPLLPVTRFPPCSFGTKRKLLRAKAKNHRCPQTASTEGKKCLGLGWVGLATRLGHGHPVFPPSRSSVCRLSSREKISLQDLSKERRPGGAGGPPIRDEDEGEEAPAGRDTRPLGLRKEYGPGLLIPR